jgi:hypothetical protein
MAADWGSLLVGQLEFYWGMHLRPRLEGLTDAEYLWEPVEGCWNLRPGPDGVFVLDGRLPEPSPAPVTTIAWRLIHVAVGMSSRASAFFGVGGVPDDADMFDPRHLPAELPGTAAAAVQFLDDGYHRWRDGVAGLDAAALSRPLGRKGGSFADEPMAALVLHVNREVMHHGGEICLLRDLHRAGPARQ